MKVKNHKYHHGNLRNELIKEASIFIQENGEEALTLNELSKIIGTTPPALYRHFSSKDDLINNIILHAFDLYDEIIISINNRTDLSCFEKLYLIGKAYISFALNNSNIFKLMFSKRFHLLKDIRNRDEAKSLHFVIDLITEAQNKGIIKKEEPLILVSTIHSTVHGIATLYINDYTYIQEELEKIYDNSFEITMTGLMIEPSNLKEEIQTIKNNIKKDELNYFFKFE